MKRTKKKLIWFGVFILTFILLWIVGSYIFVKANSSKHNISEVPKEQISRLPKSCRYICYVDFNKPSMENRFMIFDLRLKKCTYAGLVENGYGGTLKDAKCSNVPGSHCSSCGLFKVSAKSLMNNTGWDCFVLDGLDSTNSNARSRCIYIHSSYLSTIKFEKKGAYMPRLSSEGCFAISWFAMRYLEFIYEPGNMYLYAKYK